MMVEEEFEASGVVIQSGVGMIDVEVLVRKKTVNHLICSLLKNDVCLKLIHPWCCQIKISEAEIQSLV